MAFGGQRPHTKPHRGDLLVEIRIDSFTKPHRGDLSPISKGHAYGIWFIENASKRIFFEAKF
jgi:hypothetical protein